MILAHKLGTTKDLLTSRAGLLVPAQLIASLRLGDCIDKHFPQSKSNRGFSASTYVQTLMLMQHEGGFHLDDVRLLHEDKALLSLLSLSAFPSAVAMGNWLRRVGNSKTGMKGVQAVNTQLLSAALHKCRAVTLDIDASEIVAAKSGAHWTYNKNQGYMPMLGHIAETGQVVACDFRPGNQSPSNENLGFIQQCEAALPTGVRVKALRIDAAGYQAKIIEYCDTHNIRYTIRAKMSRAIKTWLKEHSDGSWQPLLDKQGKPTGQETCRTTHCIGDYGKPFTLVIQRHVKQGQVPLDIDNDIAVDEVEANGYVYRAIATNQDDKSDSEIVQWYNQRAEDSENRIKELKLDFGGDTLPCSDFKANALYLAIASLSYNLLAVMRQVLPEDLAQKRAITLRWRVYGIAAKVVTTGRQIIVKLRQEHRLLLAKLLDLMRGIRPAPT